MPQLHPDPLCEDPGGRGLVLVAALSSRWGAYRTRGGGKVVFAVSGSHHPRPARQRPGTTPARTARSATDTAGLKPRTTPGP